MLKSELFTDLAVLIEIDWQMNNSGFSARELSNMTWAIAKLPFDGSQLLNLIEIDVLRKGTSCFNWIDLSNLVRVFV